ncbi:uncharacterized protein LOC130717472 [Lotus japonicus]|uniref:uncharacterized protein LOC130717472 n=1 Tax=Lotus japonicus TaxID=34305 RepID=UPI00258E69B2|nr:uncharacterized protein LOC130717472 [Lotus japonicus]
MKKKKTIDFFFKRKERDDEQAQPSLVSPTSIDINVSNIVEVGQPTQSTVEQLVQPPPSKALRIEQERINIDALIRDPGKRPRILDYLVNQQDEIRRAYIKFGPYQFLMDEYPFSASVDAVKWMTFQACAFRGHDESVRSKNRGNFIEMIKLLASYNREVDEVQSDIRKEIGDAKFCLLVDEARDESKREQMALVIRFVDKNGYVKERFLDMIHVRDTTSHTLKEGICSILSHHNLNIKSVRGQGYDGAIGSSCKRNDELQAAYANEISHLVANDEIETGRGANQISTLQRPGDTRWSSHLNSITHLLRLYNATTTVLEDLAIEGSTYSQRGDATYAFKSLMSFEFVFILHLMKELTGICDKLCQALQKKTQDILNAICLVFTTKSLIRELRDFGWDSLLQNVRSFCDSRSIEVPDMSSSFSDIIRSRRQKDKVTIEHHYRIDVFNVVIDYQLKKLNSRFSEQATELLKLSTALDPKDSFKSFNVEHICSLVEKFYPSDFSGQEKIQLPYELQHYEFDVIKDVNFQNLSTIGELCQKLVESEKSIVYPLLDRLLRLVLTLPVSTATTERAFSAMKVIKTRLRNKMEDDFLTDYMVVYIEKEIAEKYTSDMIIDDFYSMKQRRAQL